MNTTLSESPKSRPTLVWVISAYVLLAAVWGLWTNLQLLYGHSQAPSSPVLDILKNRSPLLWTLAFAGGLVSLTAAIALLMLKRSALYLFVVSTVLGTVGTWSVMTAPALVALMGGRLFAFVGAGFGVAVSVAVCIYVYRLGRRGILT